MLLIQLTKNTSLRQLEFRTKRTKTKIEQAKEFMNICAWLTLLIHGMFTQKTSQQPVK